MLKTIIVLPDGTEISAGATAINAVKSSTVTQGVNTGEELTLGSAFANIFEATIITPGGGLALTAGDEVTVYNEWDNGLRKKVGVFALEKPTRPSANTMKVTGYDRIAKLDKELDLEAILPQDTTLDSFIVSVCQACGLSFDTSTIPSSMRSFVVRKFVQSPVTGRQLIRWAAEICGRFCRANADGVIEFGWYTQAPVSISPSGDNYYFGGGLSYEEYTVATVDAVQLRFADGESGYPWPTVPEGANSYIIAANPLLLTYGTTDQTRAILERIRSHLSSTYTGCTPCKVTIPAHLDVQAGDKVKITDANGVTITTYVMTRTQSGQKATLECTGSPRRDSASAMVESGVMQPQNGKDGVGVASVLEQYYRSNSATALSGGSWTEVYPGWVSGTYIWTRTVFGYTDGTSQTTEPICVSGANGKDGTNGKDGQNGVGIRAVDIEYYLSNSDTALSGGSWQSSAPTITEGKYLWSRNKVTYTSGTVEYTDAFCVSKAMEESAGPLIDELDKKLDREEVFKRLTDNGKMQGVYMQDGQLYINASYIKSGALSADLITAGVIRSKDGKSVVIDLDNGTADIVGSLTTRTTISGSSKYYNELTALGLFQYRIDANGLPEGMASFDLNEIVLMNRNQAEALSIQAIGGDNRVRGLVAPTWKTDATNKEYVDSTVADTIAGITPAKIGAITMDLVWENASKASSFPAQTLALGLQNYDAYIIVARYSASIGGTTSTICKTGYSSRLQGVGSGATEGTVAQECVRTATYSSGSLNIGDAYYQSVVKNDALIPIFVYGIKGVVQ